MIPVLKEVWSCSSANLPVKTNVSDEVFAELQSDPTYKVFLTEKDCVVECIVRLQRDQRAALKALELVNDKLNVMYAELLDLMP